MPKPAGTVRTLAAACLAFAVAAPLLVLLVAGPETIRTATSPGADAAAMLAGLAVVVVAIVTLRLVVTLLAVTVAALPGTCGRAGQRVAAAWSPVLLRGLVRAALGLTVAGGPLVAGTAAFADPPTFPTLDRVVATTVAPAPPATKGLPVSAPGPTGTTATPTTLTTLTTPTTPTTPTNPRAAVHVVVVRAGDTLWDIAARHLPTGHTDADVARSWPRWYAANRAVIGPDAGQIRPGQQLVAPT